MRNSDPTISTAATRLLKAALFVMVAAWSLQSQADTGLWLWGWLGVSEIQLSQDQASPGASKDIPSGPTKAVPAAKYQNDAVKKSSAATKVQPVDDPRSKDGKDRPLKIVIM